MNAAGKWTKVPYNPTTGHPASPTDPNHWVSYDHAFNAGASRPDWYSGIGFVLSDADPYTFIDLDAPKNPDGSDLPPEEKEVRLKNQKRIYEQFSSYTEISPSGNGLHIIVRGEVPAGRKRDSVEIYSSARFMTMTGNVKRFEPIKYFNGELHELWEEMGKGRVNSDTFYAGLDKETATDEEVIAFAETAGNGELFKDLFYDGNWQKWNYPSNNDNTASSEADFALVDIIGFYSKNRAQTARIFMRSKLGQRQKYKDHGKLLGYMLDRCFDNMAPPLDIQGIANNILMSQMAKEKPASANMPTESQAVVINAEKEYLNLEAPAILDESRDSVFNPPPGLLGDIARFIYSQSFMPIPEISLCGAIGLMCGICGRAYNTPTGTGLNMYTLVLASTGSGKEEAAKGIWKLMNLASKQCPTAKDFMGPSEIASAPALIKHLTNKSASVLSIIGEFGMYFKAMAGPTAPAHLQTLQRTLLKLYNESGANRTVAGMVYSDSDKNTRELDSPAFSIFAESVPEGFYQSLNESMIESGLLPRFNIIEYKGERVRPNEGGAAALPSDDMMNRFCALIANASMLNNSKMVNVVEQDEEGKKVLWDFYDYADLKIRGQREIFRQLWSRAHMKAMRMASLVAVGINPFNPIITKEAAEWAVRLVKYDTENISKRFESGDVGENSHEIAQIKIVRRLIAKYITDPWEKVARTVGDKGNDKLKPLHDNKLTPYRFLQTSTASYKVFKDDRQGATNALKRALKTLQDCGDIQVVPRSEMVKFGSSTDAYAVVNIAAFSNLDKA